MWGEKDGWLNLGGNQWVYNNPSYIKFEKKEPVNLIAGKRVVSKVDNLRFYDSPSWHDKDGAGTLDTGLGFTIDAKAIVNASSQYKVHNRKGKTYYVTANETYTFFISLYSIFHFFQEFSTTLETLHYSATCTIKVMFTCCS